MEDQEKKNGDFRPRSLDPKATLLDPVDAEFQVLHKANVHFFST